MTSKQTPAANLFCLEGYKTDKMPQGSHLIRVISSCAERGVVYMDLGLRYLHDVNAMFNDFATLV